jgi:tripartite-type tricarboxylate transporter receptor subunit TctC
VLQHIRAGKLRALAVTGAKPSGVLPDVPTLGDSGVKNVDVYSWQAVVGPKGLPPELRARFHAAVMSALNDPQVRPGLLAVGLEVVANTPDQFAAFQQQKFARWKRLIEYRKITAD